jgi:hypothetical protein
MYYHTETHSKKSPPGFEGKPRYVVGQEQFQTPFQTPKQGQVQTQSQSHSHSQNKTKGIPALTKKEPSYTNIQSICAKQCFIFLPNQGYNHHAIEETESLENLYELAYRNEFRKNTPVATPSKEYMNYIRHYSM